MAVAFTLVWLVALIAWPERHTAVALFQSGNVLSEARDKEGRVICGMLRYRTLAEFVLQRGEPRRSFYVRPLEPGWETMRDFLQLQRVMRRDSSLSLLPDLLGL